MKKFYYYYIIIIILLTPFLMSGCSCCSKVFETDPQIIKTEIFDPTTTKHAELQSTTLLYLDHSTCVIDARQNSKVFQAMIGQLGLYTDTLCLIKGSLFEKTPNTDKKPTSTDVYNIINGIEKDIPYANIGQAVKTICESNSQAILITDCEYFDQNGKNQDGFPYLSLSFKDWIKQGHCIDIIVEPYKEMYNGKDFTKKRFYFIFTDDRMKAPISQNILNEIQPQLKDSTCNFFKLTNSDIIVQHGKDMVDDNLTSTVKDFPGFEYVDISDDWKSISQFVMGIDDNGQPIEGEKALPILKNIEFKDGENYILKDISIIATNITSEYMAIEDKTIKVRNVEMSECFKLDTNELKNHRLNIYLTENIFKNDYISDGDGFGGNLIRLDFVVSKAELQSSFNYDLFTWQSLWSPEKATCVAKSIDNVLHDIEIAPTCNNRKIIHTIFLRTESYK